MSQQDSPDESGRSRPDPARVLVMTVVGGLILIALTVVAVWGDRLPHASAPFHGRGCVKYC
jgi:hypothetical protein